MAKSHYRENKIFFGYKVHSIIVHVTIIITGVSHYYHYMIHFVSLSQAPLSPKYYQDTLIPAFMENALSTVGMTGTPISAGIKKLGLTSAMTIS